MTPPNLVFIIKYNIIIIIYMVNAKPLFLLDKNAIRVINNSTVAKSKLYEFLCGVARIFRFPNRTHLGTEASLID